MNDAVTGGPTVEYYLRTVRRRGWLLVLCAVLGLAAAYGFASRQHAQFRSIADVVVNTQDISGGVTSDISKDPSRGINTQAQLAASQDVAGDAILCAQQFYGYDHGAGSAPQAGTTTEPCLLPSAGSTSTHKLTPAETRAAEAQAAGAALFRAAGTGAWSPQQLLGASTITADSDTNLIHLAVTAPDRTLAVYLANGYAAAFVINSQRAVDSQIIGLVKQTQDRIKYYSGVLTRLSTQISSRLAQNLSAADLQSQSQSAQARLEAFTGTLQNLQTDLLTKPGAARIGTRAEAAVQTAPSVKRDLIAGVAIGLVVALGLIFLLEALDRKVRSSEEASQQLGLPILARIPAPSRSLRRRDQVSLLANQSGPNGEAYRKLRVALDLANLQAAAGVVMVTSAVEQEGKSTTIANLAVAMAQVGRRVVLVDLDLRRPFLHKLFDLGDGPGVTEVALGDISVQDALSTVAVIPRTSSRTGVLAIARHGSGHGNVNGNGHGNGSRAGAGGGVLEVLTAGTQPADPSALLESEALGAMLDQLRERADIVLVDAPPVLPVSDAVSISSRVDGMVVVSRLDVVQRPMLRELRRELDRAHVAKLGLVLTGADSDSAYGYGYGYGYGSGSERGPAYAGD